LFLDNLSWFCGFFVKRLKYKNKVIYY
jgi:hypothetical protein